jgi:hypothetical protein
MKRRTLPDLLHRDPLPPVASPRPRPAPASSAQSRPQKRFPLTLPFVVLSSGLFSPWEDLRTGREAMNSLPPNHSCHLSKVAASISAKRYLITWTAKANTVCTTKTMRWFLAIGLVMPVGRHTITSSPGLPAGLHHCPKNEHPSSGRSRREAILGCRTLHRSTH